MSEEECFSGDEVESFECNKHHQIYTNFCNLTQQLLCSECVKIGKNNNIISIEKALSNVATQNQTQCVRLQQITKNYNILNETIQVQQNSVNQQIDFQQNLLQNICQQIIEIFQSRFQEIFDSLEEHRINFVQQFQDQKVIVEEYRQRAIYLERNIQNQSKISGLELLKKIRDMNTINNKTIKELSNELESLQQSDLKYQPYRLLINQELVKVVSSALQNFEKEQENRSKRMSSSSKALPQQQRNTTSQKLMSPLLTYQKASQKFKSQLFLKRPKMEIKYKTEKAVIDLLEQQPLVNDLSSIKNQSVDQSEIDIRYLSSINESSLSRFECQIQQDKFLVIGGVLKATTQQNIIEVIDLEKANVQQHDFMISSRSSFELVHSNEQILIIGGKQEGIRTALCEQYNTQTKELKISSLILTRGISNFGSVQLNNKLYICGGKTDNSILDQFYSIDLNTFETKLLPNIPNKSHRNTLSIGNEGRFLYSIEDKNCYKFDTKFATWTKMKAPQYQRSNHRSITLPDGIWIFGGRNGKSLIQYVEKFDEQDQTWKIMGECPPLVKFEAVASQDNQFVYLIGGKDENGYASSQIYVYSVVSNICKTYCSMMKPRYNHKVIKLL